MKLVFGPPRISDLAHFQIIVFVLEYLFRSTGVSSFCQVCQMMFVIILSFLLLVLWQKRKLGENEINFLSRVIRLLTKALLNLIIIKRYTSL